MQEPRQGRNAPAFRCQSMALKILRTEQVAGGVASRPLLASSCNLREGWVYYHSFAGGRPASPVLDRRGDRSSVCSGASLVIRRGFSTDVAVHRLFGQEVDQQAFASRALYAHQLVLLLQVDKQEQVDRSAGERAHERVLQREGRVQLPGRVQQPDEDPGLARRDLPEAQQAIRAHQEVALHLGVLQVVVPEAAPPPRPREARQVVLLPHLQVGQEVLEARLEAVDDPLHGRPDPVEREGVAPQAHVQQRLGQGAVAAQAHELAGLGEALLGRPAAQRQPPR
mmetsp:Transcript_22533/g.46740  ORF Transcript_22533/g.46740 Transcript_22533/m.46740 type:complete len:282 (+) Transcript_22533:345-1190(+)